MVGGMKLKFMVEGPDGPLCGPFESRVDEVNSQVGEIQVSSGRHPGPIERILGVVR